MNAHHVTLYHGTSIAAAEQIRQEGRILGPAYLTPSRHAAEQYADGGEVLAVRVDPSALLIDLDLPGGRLLEPAEAVDYIGGDWFPSVGEFIARGYSVATQGDITI